MINVQDSRSIGLGSSPRQGQGVVFVGKRLYSECLLEFLGGGGGGEELCNGQTSLQEGGVQILLVVSCYRNQDKF